MSNGFVWFHHASTTPAESASFYTELCGWSQLDGPPGLNMLSAGDAPFAATGEAQGVDVGWVPYVEVEDLAKAQKKAQKLGARILQERTRGPAGEYLVLQDPAGAAVALWKRA